MKSFFMKHRRWFISLWEVAVILVALITAYLLRFDFSVPRSEVPQLQHAVWIAVAAKMIVFHRAKLDRGWWRFAGIPDLARIFTANVTGSSVFVLVNYVIAGPSFARSVYCIDFLLCFLATAGGRFCVRLYHETVSCELLKPGRRGLLIYGAGRAGMTLLKEIQAMPSLGYEVFGFLDDAPLKRGAALLGVPVLGTGRDAARIVERSKSSHPVDEVLIAMPAATGAQMQEALANCRAAGVPCKTIPGVGDLLTGRVLTGQIRNVEIGDLLGRKPVQLDESRIRSTIAHRSILVTGAGGSIGSELCRQLSRFEPAALVALDQSESTLFNIDLEIRRKHPSLRVVAALGDIRDHRRVEEVIRQHEIDSIFHAAAYKHVPMLQLQVLEAAQNNILGTRNVLHAAARNGVSEFLMISSDKAVNPVNVMGATKRVAELIVSSMTQSTTKFVSVRFGNVLGSNGSVVPLFQEQIAAGGPVTVTHPEMRRYFMTISEAVQLVLQASTMGKKSEIFVLDMGEPVRIVDLARNMIRLSGRLPDEEIEIRYTGLRPGEKLSEELISDSESVLPTFHPKIKIFQSVRVNAEWLNKIIAELEVAIKLRDEKSVAALIQNLVPEYRPENTSRLVPPKEVVRAVVAR
jgi:FlaA1/EpsC-like NDP-sugar epimerase